jgi:hypothetical protein
VRATLAVTKKFPDFDFEEFDGVHEWRGDVAWKFLAKYL